MAMYGCIYFDWDKSLSIVPQNKCILRQSFEEGNEVEEYHGRTRKGPNKFG